MRVLQHYLPSSKVRIVSNIIITPPPIKTSTLLVRSFLQRRGYVFVGHMAHYPNQQALLTLVRYVVPSLRARAVAWRGPAAAAAGSGAAGNQRRGSSWPLPPPLLHVVGSGVLPQVGSNLHCLRWYLNWPASGGPTLYCIRSWASSPMHYMARP